MTPLTDERVTRHVLYTVMCLYNNKINVSHAMSCTPSCVSTITITCQTPQPIISLDYPTESVAVKLNAPICTLTLCYNPLPRPSLMPLIFTISFTVLHFKFSSANTLVETTDVSLLPYGLVTKNIKDSALFNVFRRQTNTKFQSNTPRAKVCQSYR